MERKRIGIISSYAFIVNNANYGSILQYYALQEYLKGRGHCPFWIRYVIPKTNNKFKKIIKYLLFKVERTNHSRIKSFFYFCNTHLNLSRELYIGEEQINASPPDADLFITGSDQVWGGVLPANYLTFVKDKNKKISYAASFGKSKLSEQHYLKIKSWLANFNKISVREDSGVEICNEMGLDAIQLVDPTLLLEENDYPRNLPNEDNYIYGYLINLGSTNSIDFSELEQFSNRKKMKLCITTASGFEKYVPGNYLCYPTIEKWLGYYFKAEYVITNTFHGTVFAIIYKKPFIVYLQGGISNEQNCRFYSLLESLELTDRIWTENKTIDYILDQDIDWHMVEGKLRILREKTNLFFDSLGL